ncbi:PH domain-containing protein [Flavobacterium kingsejongi]|nr:PH domain-containing protein [Flavobacterium kingsejongi]
MDSETPNKAFQSPQRQSLTGVVVMFFDSIQRILRGLWPFLLLWIFKIDETNRIFGFIGGLVIIVLTAIFAYLRYRNFTFYIDDANNEFVINHGVINKTKIGIRMEKIQQVNINQSLIQKIIGVYALELDTAGSDKKEATIKAVSHDMALELKSRLLNPEFRAQQQEEIIPELEPTDDRVINISLLSLLKIGFTSNYVRTIFLIWAFGWTIYENYRNLGRGDAFETTEIDSYFTETLIMSSALLFVFLLVLLVLIVNIVRVIIKYYNFRIVKKPQSLLLSYGLLDTKETIIRPEKVQIATIRRNYFQKKLNVLEIKIRQASGTEDEQKKSKIEIPGCNTQEKEEIIQLIFNRLPQKGTPLYPNFRKLIFPILFRIVLPVAAFFIIGKNIEIPLYDYSYLVPFYITFAGIIIYFGYRNYRLYTADDFIIKQSGAWDIEHEIFEPYKIQAITTRQYFWHKSADIGHVSLHTAGGTIDFMFTDFTTIKKLVNQWLYEVETSDKNWM